MADDPNSISSWIQTGGVVAFATAVLLQLRELKPILSQLQTTMAALLERDRMRGVPRAGTIDYDEPLVDQPAHVPVDRSAPTRVRTGRTPVHGTPTIYSHVRGRGSSEE